MYVAEVIQPGAWLEADPGWTPELARDIESMLRKLVDELDDCAVALDLFEQEQQRDKVFAESSWEKERERERTHEEALQAAGVELSWDDMRHRVELDLRRADWKAGKSPEHYIGRRAFLHAETFVGHLDMLVKLLKGLSKKAATRASAIDPLVATLDANMGGAAKDIRDSIQHVDERILGRGKKAPIVTQPVNSHGILAPHGGVFVIRGLFNNHLGYTTDDGALKTVEISVTTLATAQSAVQAALNTFMWRGQKQYHPRK